MIKSIIKNITKLSHKKNRVQQKLFVAEGLKVCQALINAHFELEYLVLSDTNTHAFDHYSCNISSKIVIVNNTVINKVSNLTTCTGIIGIFRIKALTEQPISNGLILYNLQDPGNVGTLIRSCAAMNKTTIIFINSVDPYHPKVVQASAGSFANLNFIQCSWQQVIDRRKHDKFNIGALVVKNGSSPKEINFKNMLLVVGNEGNGIPQDIVDQCDERITLSMPGNTESLNAGVAGSIALYMSIIL